VELALTARDGSSSCHFGILSAGLGEAGRSSSSAMLVAVSFGASALTPVSVSSDAVPPLGGSTACAVSWADDRPGLKTRRHISARSTSII